MTIKSESRLSFLIKDNSKKVFFALALLSFVIALFGIVNLDKIRKIPGIITSNNFADLRICRCALSRKVRFKRDDGLEISGNLYGKEDSQIRPGIIFLHGNTPVGKELPFYQVIATKLAERGYLVLTIDFTGFGQSDDPYRFGTTKAVNNNLDADAALEYLQTIPNLAKEKIYIIGHSRGSTPAFDVGIARAEIKAIIGIGPARRITERFLNPVEQNYFWQREQRNHQQVYGKNLPKWYSKQDWLEQMLKRDITRHIPYFQQSGHKPILLIDGEKESQADREYLSDYYQQLAPPKKYVTIANDNHYANTDSINIKIMKINIYNNKVVTKTINTIDNFLKNIEEQLKMK